MGLEITKTSSAYDSEHFVEEYSKVYNVPSMMQMIREDFMKQVRPGSMIVDVPCGPGRDTKGFLENGTFKVVGVDLSWPMLRKAKETAPQAVFIHADINDIDLIFEPRSAGGVFIAGLFQEYGQKSNVSNVLKKANHVMEDNAILFVDAKRGQGSEVRYDFGGERTFFHYQPEELKVMVEESGFKVKKIFPNTGRHSQWINIFATVNKREQSTLTHWVS